MKALKERERVIRIDLDVAAPVLLIPEFPWVHSRLSNNDNHCVDAHAEPIPTLVIDLGRLTFCNDSVPSDEIIGDDWTLSLADIQVLCTASIPARSGLAPLRLVNCHLGEVEGMVKGSVHALVEPFSLDLNIQTQFDTEECNITAEDSVSIEIGKSNGENCMTKIRVRAVLPRLVFNPTTSAVRLISRLQMQWKSTAGQQGTADAASAREGAATPPSFLGQSRPFTALGSLPTRDSSAALSSTAVDNGEGVL